MNFIKMICQYAISSVITLALALTLFVTNLFWPAASEAQAQALPVQTNQAQSNQSWLTGILQLALTSTPSDLLYTKDHEWVRVEGNIATIGVTEFAANELGAVTSAELVLKVGDSVSQGDEIGIIDSVTKALDYHTPIKGEVIEINKKLDSSPELINEDPYGEGWLVKIRFSDRSALNALLSNQQYDEYVERSWG